MRRMQVLALSPIPEEGAGCRFRIAQYVPYLRDAGFDVTISPFYTREYFELVYQRGRYATKAVKFMALAARRYVELLGVRRYDLVFLYREAIPLGPPLLETLIAKSGVPIVYDFDVSEANRAIAFLKDPGRAATIVRLSRRVVVGNAFLAEFARRHNPAVTVIPTAVDTTRFVPAERRGQSADRKLVIGWIGSPTTFRYLEALAGVLREVAATHTVTLKVSGAGQPVRFPGVDVVEEPWSMRDEVSLFNTCDLGVYPLTDDEWSKGKCGFKAIQCMACGVPVVAAAVGVNREIITDGVDSYLASSHDEWVGKLKRLLSDGALREQMAIAGRRTIEARYSLRVTAPQLAAVMSSALDSPLAAPLAAQGHV
jgi:glycosyltransferase involved in cell wall biosynthesis